LRTGKQTFSKLHISNTFLTEHFKLFQKPIPAKYMHKKAPHCGAYHLLDNLSTD